MRTLLQDVRFGLRLLRNSPGFAAVAVLTLGLGIAANTTVFSWIDSVLLHPFGGGAATGRLAALEMITADAPNGANQLSYLDYRDYGKYLKSADGLIVHREDVFSLGEGVNTQAAWGELVSGNYFEVLGVRPALGRAFTREEDGDRPGAYPVAVISNRLWRTRFHSDPAVAGKTLRVNRHALTIVGVAPPEFRGTMPGLAFDLWIPVTMGPALGALGDDVFRNREVPESVQHRAAEARGDGGAGARGGGHAVAKPGGSVSADQPRGAGDGAAGMGNAHRRTGVAPGPAAHSGGRVRSGAADRVRERGEPAAGANGVAPERTGRAPGARGGPRAAGAATPHRDVCARGGGRAGRAAALALDGRFAARAGAECRRPGGDGTHAECAHSGLHGAGLRSDGACGGSRARPRSPYAKM